MRPRAEEMIPTRATLLARLKDWRDQESWRQFFDTYWGFIYSVARQSGLTEPEAQDAVQETLFAVARQMPNFRYDPAGSFKAWLLRLTRWKIIEQLRKRGPSAAPAPGPDSGNGSIVERSSEPSECSQEERWEADWQHHLLEAAMARLQRRLDPLKYQIFDCYAQQGWAAEKVAMTFGVPVTQVYVTKHRVIELVKYEVERLEKGIT